MTELSNDELRRYSRQVVMAEVGLDGQQALKDASVLCVGAGGLGSPASLYLAAAGIGRLGIVEFDTVDISNIQRQVLYATADVGRPKLEAALERLAALNPGICLQEHPQRLDAGNVMALMDAYDVIVDGSDNFPTRYLVNDAAALAGKPVVHASVYRLEGQISVFDARRGPCLRCLFPEPPPAELVPSCAEGGVLGMLPGLFGSLQALEVVKLLLGRGEPLIGRLMLFDGLAGSWRTLPVHKDPDCALCGPAATITEPIAPTSSATNPGKDTLGDSGDEAPGCAVTAALKVSPKDLAILLATQQPPLLLDVREPAEFAIASIPGALLIPLAELARRLDDLEAGRPCVITCHRGPRSERAREVLLAAGFADVRILEGGVDAWAQHIDASMRRY